ncbi:DVU3141 family protein [Roseomonas fluvialis]|uniref:DVU3141 family protein n=1 Tax=Roseomonas fluvialis TaxID=1750527 RepID=UPI001FCAB935|nr:DVU3141 family protein [Roseomonas fluvialis]
MALALLAGCAEPTAVISPGTDTPVAITDPVVAFAANASPGAEDSVVLPSTGQTARLRMVRSYTAASGRECREIQVNTSGTAQMRLLCRAGTGWREARPLLRDGVGRP